MSQMSEFLIFFYSKFFSDFLVQLQFYISLLFLSIFNLFLRIMPDNSEMRRERYAAAIFSRGLRISATPRNILSLLRVSFAKRILSFVLHLLESILRPFIRARTDG